MAVPLEARSISPQEAGIIHSPILDVVRQEILGQGAFVAPEEVKTQGEENSIVAGRTLQEVRLSVAPSIYMYAKGTDKGRYAEECVEHLRTLMRRLDTRALEGGEALASKALVWPVANRGSVYYGGLAIDELLGLENKEIKTKITEVKPGSLKEVAVEPGIFEADSATDLIRTIIINVCPHPLLALIVPRIQANRTLPQDDLTVGISIDRLLDIQRSGAKSGTAAVALSLGVVTEQELKQIFFPHQ